MKGVFVVIKEYVDLLAAYGSAAILDSPFASNLPKWKYDFSCKKCRHIQYVKDKAKRRDGDYCIKFIERTDAGLPSPIHADDDRVVRCDCFETIPEEGDSE